MRKNYLLFLLLLASCATAPKSVDTFTLEDIDKDFPKTDTIALTHRGTFNILPMIYSFMIQDSVMFSFEENPENFGYCYSINCGEKLSVILNKGKAKNEMSNLFHANIRIFKDSIQFTDTNLSNMTTFSVKDIITKPIGDREFSIVDGSKFMSPSYFMKVDNNIIFGNTDVGCDHPNANYFIYDGDSVTYLKEIKKEIFEMEENSEYILNRVRMSFTPRYASHKNRVATVDNAGIMLKVIDVDKKTVETERNYNKFNYDYLAKTSNGLNTKMISCNSEKIYCLSVKSIKQENGEDRSKKRYECFIFTFDWKLNPLKKHYIGTFSSQNSRYYLSENGKKVYLMTLNDEKQELFEAVIE